MKKKKKENDKTTLIGYYGTQCACVGFTLTYWIGSIVKDSNERRMFFSYLRRDIVSPDFQPNIKGNIIIGDTSIVTYHYSKK